MRSPKLSSVRLLIAGAAVVGLLLAISVSLTAAQAQATVELAASGSQPAVIPVTAAGAQVTRSNAIGQVLKLSERSVMTDSQGLYIPYVTRSGSDTAEEILIPAGSFQMGCDSSNPAETCSYWEQPLHSVYLDAYTIDKYEMTNGRYKACVDAGVCTAPQSVNSHTRSPYYGSAAYADYPVINVNWYQAKAFCEWEGKRLPTEAEWEKAARGSSDTRKYPWGDSAPDCTKLNYYWCVDDTSRVGSYPSGASLYGVMDMAGNVREWVNDWYELDYYSVSPGSNPPGPATGDFRVMRGGSWYGQVIGSVRAAARTSSNPGYWSSGDDGFRCARSQ